MIKGHCKSNLADAQSEAWPTLFVAVPRIGDYVRGLSTSQLMRVANITHKIKIELPMYAPQHVNAGEPYVEIELVSINIYKNKS